MGRDGVVDGRRIDPAHADVGARQGRDGPGEAPAVAMEHRQGPEIDRMVRHLPTDGVRDGVQVGPPVVIDDALRIARGAGGIVERDRLPFVGGQFPFVIGIALGQQAFVIGLAQGDVLVRGFRIDDIDDRDVLAPGHGEGGLHRRREFRVGQQNLGLAVVQAEGDGFGVQAHVQGIDDGAQHWHGEGRFVHFRRVGAHDGDGLQPLHSALFQRRGEPSGPRIGLHPGEAFGAVNDRDMVRIGPRRALQERIGGEGRVVRANRVQRHFVHIDFAQVRLRRKPLHSGC